MSTPSCPSCGASVPAGATQCRACKQVLGEDNRCPRCHALSPSIARGDGIVCSACGADRERFEGTVVVPESDVVRAFERGSYLPWLIGGGSAFVSGSGLAVAGFTAAMSDGSFGFAFAGITTVFSLAIAAAGAYFTRRTKLRAEQHRRFDMEQRISGLAYQLNGSLTAADVSSALRIPLAEADAMLTELAKAGRAQLDIGDEGQLRYSFVHDKPTRGIRVRVSRASQPEAEVPTDRHSVQRRDQSS